MAEFSEVIKNKERMCKSITTCGRCPLTENHKPCSIFEFNNAEEAEKIIMDWAKEHPIITNGMKFKEVFGAEFGADISKTKCPFTCGGRESCANCPYDDFWDKEYIEPKGEEQ